MRLWWRILALASAACLGIALIWHLTLREPARPDAVVLNDAVEIAAATWPTTTAADLEPIGAPAALVAPDGAVVTSVGEGEAGPAPSSGVDAARRGWISAPLIVGDSVVATVYVADDAVARQAAANRTVAWWSTGALATLTASAALLVVHAHRRIVAPFERLRTFAAKVAAGDLEAPLRMDRSNVFGAWTESFDLMRTELTRARRRQEEAEASKRELVSQIGHDIRTPVASIAATAEVLRASASSPATAARLDVIEAKSRQLESLVADLFGANEDQMDALTVLPGEISSTELAALIHEADYEGRARIESLPDCLVSADSRRLAQVFDNVLTNSYKYAGTPIEVRAAVDGDLLLLDVVDSGPGVDDQELGPIFARGFRGAGAGNAPGRGIGLFTCSWLMEHMGGAISAANVEPPGSGLRITIALPLAGR